MVIRLFIPSSSRVFSHTSIRLSLWLERHHVAASCGSPKGLGIIYLTSQPDNRWAGQKWLCLRQPLHAGWSIDQHLVKTDRQCDIVSDPCRRDGPQYIVQRIGKGISCSLETVANAVVQMSCFSFELFSGRAPAIPDSENRLTNDHRIWLAMAPELVHISETTPIGNRYTR